MIASMTGFAAAAHESALGHLGVDIKTVNHRYLEFQARMPEELRALEPAMREAVSAKLSRGKVDCRVTFTPLPQAARSISPDPQAMESLAKAASEVAARFPEARTLSISEVLHWPGILADQSPAGDALREEAMGVMKRALSELNASREREGAKLAEVLRQRLDGMSALVKEAQPLVPGAVKAFQEKLATKIAEAAATPTDERVQQEIVLYAARIDVDEEIARLQTHIAEFHRVLDKGGACGKRLDFLCQELNREANTLGSKSVANEMTRISVELKVLIEQMREQVQNIE
jgi:uncharacterized protein (TIGR00255 family)